MALDIAFGILLAIGMIVAGIVALAIIFLIVRETWEFILVGSFLAIGFHFIGGWVFLLLVGFLVIAEMRDLSEKKTTEEDGEIEHR